MVSFCNLALCDMSEYLGKYGDYTIGLKSSWKFAYRLSPVWYRAKDAFSLHPIMDTYEKVHEFPVKDCTQDFNNLIWSQLGHTKNFEGPLQRRHKKCYRFFDEHEFRYVPTLEMLSQQQIAPILTGIEYEEYKKGHKSLSLIDNTQIALSFGIEDVAFILVKDKGQIALVYEMLEKLSNPSKGQKKYVRCPHILTHDEVNRNIIGLSHHK